MANPIIRGFANLARFSGRDRRGEFWPYAGVVFVVMFVAMGAAAFWAVSPMITEAAQFAAEHPDSATVQVSPGAYSVQIDAGAPDAPMPDFTRMFGAMGACLAILVVLLAAAVTRRLHDRGLGGYWGLAPVLFLAVAFVGFPMMISNMMATDTPDMGLFLLLFLNNLLYMIALAGLILVLALPGTRGPNRYGPETTP